MRRRTLAALLVALALALALGPAPAARADSWTPDTVTDLRTAPNEGHRVAYRFGPEDEADGAASAAILACPHALVGFQTGDTGAATLVGCDTATQDPDTCEELLVFSADDSTGGTLITTMRRYLRVVRDVAPSAAEAELSLYCARAPLAKGGGAQALSFIGLNFVTGSTDGRCAQFVASMLGTGVMECTTPTENMTTTAFQGVRKLCVDAIRCRVLANTGGAAADTLTAVPLFRDPVGDEQEEADAGLEIPGDASAGNEFAATFTGGLCSPYDAGWLSLRYVATDEDSSITDFDTACTVLVRQ